MSHIRELREKAGLSRRVVAERLFSVRGSWKREQRLAAREQRLADYEEGKALSLNAVSLLPWAEALGCGVTDLEVA